MSVAIFKDSGNNSNKGTPISTPAANAVKYSSFGRNLVANIPPEKVEKKVTIVNKSA